LFMHLETKAIHAGLEHPDDLLKDLEQALEA
jgi:cystathionine beta-lyase/cystathionine gamma-synthase